MAKQAPHTDKGRDTVYNTRQDNTSLLSTMVEISLRPHKIHIQTHNPTTKHINTNLLNHTFWLINPTGTKYIL